MKYLLLNFSAPLQAWGGTIPGNLRTIENHPTKSGVVGFLAACLGIKWDEPELLVALADRITVACRVDAPGSKTSDFHIVKNTFLRYGPKYTGRAKLKSIISLRDYLCNAVFTICIQGENLEELYNAIREPVFVPFLGRKSCLPNPVFPRIIEASSLYRAFEQYKVAEIHADLIPVLPDDDQVQVFWEGTDDSITPVRQEWKYDQPNGTSLFRQRLEYMGYIERVA